MRLSLLNDCRTVTGHHPRNDRGAQDNAGLLLKRQRNEIGAPSSERFLFHTAYRGCRPDKHVIVGRLRGLDPNMEFRLSGLQHDLLTDALRLCRRPRNEHLRDAGHGQLAGRAPSAQSSGFDVHGRVAIDPQKRNAPKRHLVQRSVTVDHLEPQLREHMPELQSLRPAIAAAGYGRRKHDILPSAQREMQHGGVSGCRSLHEETAVGRGSDRSVRMVGAELDRTLLLGRVIIIAGPRNISRKSVDGSRADIIHSQNTAPLAPVRWNAGRSVGNLNAVDPDIVSRSGEILQ